MTDAFIIATAATPFGRHPDRTLIDLAVAAGGEALETAGITAAAVDALYLGNFLGQSLQHQGVLASLVARRLGLATVPTTTVEGACASAGIALRHGVLAVRARAADVVLCIGAEHLTAVDVSTVTGGLAEATDQQTDGAAGLTFPGFFGLVAHAYRGRYGTTREQLAAVPVKNRRHGATNPLAMFREPVTTALVEQSRLIADPLRLYDCSPIADGAAAAVVTSAEAATTASEPPIRVLACEQASGPTQIAQIDDLTSFAATRAAAGRAYRAAKVGPGEIDVVELHDCFSIAEIVDSEDLGLFSPGEAAEAIEAGATSFGGDGPVVNPSGGLIARGHPVGATGLAQIHELVSQLRGTARNQVGGARLALAHNLGGSGATATVTILSG
jgi:acetyl-CoA C-acetyltransferase